MLSIFNSFRCDYTDLEQQALRATQMATFDFVRIFSFFDSYMHLSLSFSIIMHSTQLSPIIIENIYLQAAGTDF